MNKKTKNSIILSSLAVIAVVSSLIAGSTYALFTSKDEVNIAVTSGTVDATATIENLNLYSPTLIASDGSSIINTDNAATNSETTHNFANGGTVSFANSTLTITNMTPGDKATFDIALKNNSNVNIKYRTSISKLDTELSLFEGLDIKIDSKKYVGTEIVSDYLSLSANGTIVSIPVEIELPTDASNYFQGKSAKLSVGIETIQANAYTASYSEVTDEDTALSAFSQTGNKTIKLMNDVKITLNNRKTNIGLSMKGDKVVLDLNEKTLTIPQCFTFSDWTAKELIIKNGSIVSNNQMNGGDSIFNWDDDRTKLTLDNVDVSYAVDVSYNTYAAIQTNDTSADINIYNSTIHSRVSIGGYGSCNVNIYNSTISEPHDLSYSYGAPLVNVPFIGKAKVNINIKDSTFDASNGKDTDYRDIFAIDNNGTTVNVFSGTFNVKGAIAEGNSKGHNVLVSKLKVNGIAGGSSTINFYGGKINDKYFSSYADDSVLFKKYIAVDKEQAEHYNVEEIYGGYSLTLVKKD